MKRVVQNLFLILCIAQQLLYNNNVKGPLFPAHIPPPFFLNKSINKKILRAGWKETKICNAKRAGGGGGGLPGTR